MVLGSARPLLEAFQHATTELAKWLAADYGLTERGAQIDCGDYALLRRYERARKQDILAFEATTDGLQKLFSSRAVSVEGVRDFGLALLDAAPQCFSDDGRERDAGRPVDDVA